MHEFSLYLLGPPRLERDGEIVNVDTRKAVALVAYLAHAEEQFPRDALAAFLWPELDDRRARAALRRTLSALKKAAGEAHLSISRSTLALADSDEIWVDTRLFCGHLEAVSAHEHVDGRICDACLDHLEAAVALYRDDFMAGFSLRDSISFDDWHLMQSETLRRELSGALSLLVTGRIQRGEYQEALPHAQRWLQLDPLQEEAHRQLMRLYVWSGQRNAALAQYQSCVRLLDEELGVAPLAETSELYRAIQANELPAPEPIRPPESKALSPKGPPAITPLVGRDEEMAWLQQQYEAIGPDGRLLALAGEAGIGKTRLAEAFVAQVREKGGAVLHMRCYAGESDLAYEPLAQGLRDALEIHPDALTDLPAHWLAEVKRLLPELDALIPAAASADAQSLSGPGAQSRFYEGLLQAIVHLCQGPVPGCLFIDDIHWADTATVDLISFLARRLARRPLVVLITWRSDEVGDGHQLNEMMTEAQQAQLGDIRHLARLGAKEVGELIHLLRPSLSPKWWERLHVDTDGLPFFVTEYLAALEDMGESAALEPQEATVTIPRGVRALLRSRLTQVSETGRQLLQTAAAIGHHFDYELLRKASGRSEEESVEALDELMARGLVLERRTDSGEAVEHGPWYDFNHHKLRELVYDEMSLVRRRLLHRRLARTLVQDRRAQARGGGTAGQIALHFHLAGDDEAAAGYYVAAGDHARATFANQEALNHYQAALALNHPESPTLQEACGDLQTLLGEYRAAVGSYEAAASRQGEDGQFRLAHKIGQVYQRRGNWEMADQQFAAARKQWSATAGATELARLLIDWSHVSHKLAKEKEAWDLAQEAYSLAQEQGDEAALALTHNILGILARNHSDLEEAAGHFEQSIQLAKSAGQPDIQVAALNNMAQAESAGDRFEQARALLESALALCASYGDRHRQAALHSNLADILYQMGLKEQSMAQLMEAATIYAEVGREGESWQPEIWKLTEW